MGYQKVKGTLDFFDLDSKKFRYIESKVRNIITGYGFDEIITPTFENTDVFIRSVGESSDIVTKEMYTFLDKGERSLTLRPEGTAAIARCFVENKLYATPGIKKYFYMGSMFRYERPQAGRYREFHQFGVEVYGDSSPYLDCDVILSAYRILSELGIKGIKLKINTIGDFESRKAYGEALRVYFKDHLDELCDDCKNRFNKNPMRILDCKVDSNNPILINAPKIKDYLTTEAKEYFNKILKTLDSIGVPYVLDDNLVRGLDYYTDTVFEFISDFDGLAICAGGKYAEMLKEFNGPDIPGIGYAFGIERIKAIMEKEELFPKLDLDTDCVIISLDDESKLSALNLAYLMRQKGLLVEMDYKNNSLKPQFKLCDRVNPHFIIIIGEEERIKGIYTVKDNINKTEEKVELNKIIDYVKR